MPKAPGETPATGSRLGFFELVSSLQNPADWENRRIYIYRNDQVVQDRLKQKHNSQYTECLQGPFPDDEAFDKEYIHSRFGGGNFRLLLQNAESKRNDHVESKINSLLVEGAPNWSLREIQAGLAEGEETEEEAAPEQAGQADMAILERVMARNDELQDRLVEVIQARNNPEQEAHSRAMEIMATASQTGIKTILESIPKRDDQAMLLQAVALLKELTPAQPAQQQLSLKDVLDLVAQARKENPAINWSTVIGTAVTALGALPPVIESLRGLGLFSGAGANVAAAEPDRMIAMLDFAKSALPQLPQLLQGLMAMGQQRQQQQPQQPSAVVQPALAPAQPPAAATPPAQPPAQEQQNMQLQRFALAMARMWDENRDPAFMAESVRLNWTDEARGLVQFLTPFGDWWQNPTVLNQMAQWMPQLSVMLYHQEFATWAPQWWDYLLHPEKLQEQDGDGEEGVQG